MYSESAMAALKRESSRIPPGPKTWSLRLRYSLSWRIMIPTAVTSLDTEAILRMLPGRIGTLVSAIP